MFRYAEENPFWGTCCFPYKSRIAALLMWESRIPAVKTGTSRTQSVSVALFTGCGRTSGNILQQLLREQVKLVSLSKHLSLFKSLPHLHLFLSLSACPPLLSLSSLAAQMKTWNAGTSLRLWRNSPSALPSVLLSYWCLEMATHSGGDYHFQKVRSSVKIH